MLRDFLIWFGIFIILGGVAAMHIYVLRSLHND